MNAKKRTPVFMPTPTFGIGKSHVFHQDETKSSNGQMQKPFKIKQAKKIFYVFKDIDLSFLTPREVDILYSLIGLKESVSDLSIKYYVSEEKIHQIYIQAITGVRDKYLDKYVVMKRDHDNILQSYELRVKENSRLSIKNAELQDYISKIPEYKKKEIDNLIDQTGILSKDITELDLSMRIVNCLVQYNIRTLGAIVRYEKKAFLKLTNFGRKSLTELEEMVRWHGLHFGDLTRINYPQ